MATALVIAVAGSIIFGLLPDQLFDSAMVAIDMSTASIPVAAGI